MVAGCGMNCIKYILFVVNFLFFALGIAALGLGIYALVDDDMSALTKINSDGKIEEFNAVGLLQSGAIVLIVGGVCLVVLGFLGCCGAIKEVKCLLGTYAAIVILIIIIQIAAAGVAIAFKGRITDELKKGLVNGIKENYDGNPKSDNAFSRAWDFAQVKFECCGVTDSAVDFDDSPWKKNSSNAVPNSCCELADRDKFFDDNELVPNDKLCPNKTIGADNPFTNKPCYDEVKDWIENKAAIIIGIALGIVFVEIIAVVFAICLYRSIGEE